MRPSLIIATLATLFLVPRLSWAHCDTLGGPVVSAARKALETGNLEPVLAGVKKPDEAEVRAVFTRARAVRKLGPQARELADRSFFETVVRVHRAGEGAPYTGLKATAAEPVIAKADLALKTGSVDELAKGISGAVDKGIRQRFERVVATRRTAGRSVAAGREFVEAYVQYTHYLEGVHQVAVGPDEHHGKEKAPERHAENE